MLATTSCYYFASLGVAITLLPFAIVVSLHVIIVASPHTTTIDSLYVVMVVSLHIATIPSLHNVIAPSFCCVPSCYYY